MTCLGLHACELTASHQALRRESMPILVRGMRPAAVDGSTVVAPDESGMYHRDVRSDVESPIQGIETFGAGAVPPLMDRIYVDVRDL